MSYFCFALTSLTVSKGRQKLPLLIRLSYRFVTTYAFSDIRFLKVSRSEEKELGGGSMVSNYTLLLITKVVLSQSK
nr:hypothetical protein [Candidatus Enterovibrio escacola]